jgi:hypothetical protein
MRHYTPRHVDGDNSTEEGRHMAADGTWNLTMDTPMGERKATLAVTTAGGALTGKQSAEGNSADIFDGTVSGNEVAWKVSITEPMALTLEYSGTISGDTMSGNMKIGMFGSSSFTGTRA